MGYIERSMTNPLSIIVANYAGLTMALMIAMAIRKQKGTVKKM